jgi:hypothetical protein
MLYCAVAGTLADAHTAPCTDRRNAEGHTLACLDADADARTQRQCSLPPTRDAPRIFDFGASVCRPP